ncbi:MAG: OadG family transporter subunit [Oscillospiraceae bacterium]|jgi:sodium pump decarboxylase gamma subunit
MNILTSLFAANTVDMNSEYVASVVFTGLTVVFAGLILLVIFVSLFGSFFKKKQEPKKKAEIVQKNSTAVSSKSVQKHAFSPVIESGISEEVVAVISAAIAAMSASSDGKILSVRSIRQVKPLRPAWATAGVLENTKPF